MDANTSPVEAAEPSSDARRTCRRSRRPRRRRRWRSGGSRQEGQRGDGRGGRSGGERDARRKQEEPEAQGDLPRQRDAGRPRRPRAGRGRRRRAPIARGPASAVGLARAPGAEFMEPATEASSPMAARAAEPSKVLSSRAELQPAGTRGLRGKRSARASGRADRREPSRCPSPCADRGVRRHARTNFRRGQRLLQRSGAIGGGPQRGHGRAEPGRRERRSRRLERGRGRRSVPGSTRRKSRGEDRGGAEASGARPAEAAETEEIPEAAAAPATTWAAARVAVKEGRKRSAAKDERRKEERFRVMPYDSAAAGKPPGAKGPSTNGIRPSRKGPGDPSGFAEVPEDFLAFPQPLAQDFGDRRRTMKMSRSRTE